MSNNEKRKKTEKKAWTFFTNDCIGLLNEHMKVYTQNVRVSYVKYALKRDFVINSSSNVLPSS